MATRKHGQKDVNQIAAAITAKATATPPTHEEQAAEMRRQAAAILGSMGGKKGGPARAKALSAKRRKEIAKKAIAARWAKTKRG